MYYCFHPNFSFLYLGPSFAKNRDEMGSWDEDDSTQDFFFKKETKLVFSPNKFVLPPALDLPSLCCPLVFIKIKPCQNESMQIFWTYTQFRSLLRNTLPKLGMKQGLKDQELRSSGHSSSVWDSPSQFWGSYWAPVWSSLRSSCFWGRGPATKQWQKAQAKNPDLATTARTWRWQPQVCKDFVITRQIESVHR
jgi:hypothetical protein